MLNFPKLKYINGLKSHLKTCYFMLALECKIQLPLTIQSYTKYHYCLQLLY